MKVGGGDCRETKKSQEKAEKGAWEEPSLAISGGGRRSLHRDASLDASSAPIETPICREADKKVEVDEMEEQTVCDIER
eukprot:8311741-Pyramimonas_sp.AAC.1